MDIWVSVYLVGGNITSISVYTTKDDALNAFDTTVYNIGYYDTTYDFDDYDRDEDTGECHFVENSNKVRHPTEMMIVKIRIPRTP